MPLFNQTHIDRPLTNVSIAYMQDQKQYVAARVIPMLSVLRQSDIFYKYTKGTFLRDEARERAALSESAGGDYDVVSDTYFAKKYSFHKDISPEEIANTEAPLEVRKDATLFVTSKLLLKRELVFRDTFFKAGVWDTEIAGAATSGTGTAQYWDMLSSDPIGDVQKAIIAVASKTGYKPNKLVVSPAVHNAISNHPDILERIKYTQLGITTEALIASLFGLDAYEVSWGVVDTSVRNSATPDVSNTDFVYGKSAMLVYTPGTPGLRQPSAGYLFSWKLPGTSGFDVTINRLPIDILGVGTERIEGTVAFAAKVVSSELGVFFNGIVQ